MWGVCWGVVVGSVRTETDPKLSNIEGCNMWGAGGGKNPNSGGGKRPLQIYIEEGARKPLDRLERAKWE